MGNFSSAVPSMLTSGLGAPLQALHALGNSALRPGQEAALKFLCNRRESAASLTADTAAGKVSFPEVIDLDVVHLSVFSIPKQ